MVAELTPENLRQPALHDGETDADRVVLSAVSPADSSMVPMPEPEVRGAPDSGAIHWHTQIEPGLPPAEAAPGAPGGVDAVHP
jgi:hypothetical protein